MRRRTGRSRPYDVELYDCITRDVDSGAPITWERIVKTVVEDSRAGSHATAIALRLVKHTVPNPKGRPWRWDDVDAILQEAMAAFLLEQRKARPALPEGELAAMQRRYDLEQEGRVRDDGEDLPRGEQFQRIDERGEDFFGRPPLTAVQRRSIRKWTGT